MKLERVPTVIRVILLFVVLYMFFISIETMGSAFKLFGKGFAEGLITTTSNPIVGLLIGILATSVVQSSSTTTSIVVGLVGAGVLNVPSAIPIVMGANIGTSVTNTLVSMAHITRKQEFKRAFGGALIHDYFNVLTVLVFLPIEYFTGYLQKSATYMEHMFEGIGGLKFASPLKVIVKPAVHAIKDVLGSVWGDHTFPIAISLLIIAFIILFVSLKYLVDILKSLLIGRIESMMSEVLFQNTIRALILGLILTSLVQSSSITTSLAVPLIGAGLLSLEKVFPYMVGANIGTTVTAIMASLVTKNPAAITVAFAHLLFNISGGLVFLPLRKIPIAMSEFMGRFACEHRYLAIAYIIVFFYVIPISVIVLSRTF